MTDPAAPDSDAAPAVGLARAASLIGLGSTASRVLGMLREVALARYFGASSLVGAYTVASFIPMMLYDMIIGGMISSALVPVFSEYAERRGRAELGRLAGVVLTLTLVAMTALAALLALAAPQVATLLGGGLPAPELAAAANLVRVMAPATVFLGLSGVSTALLYALRRFTLPAFVVAVFNAALVGAIVASGGRTIYAAALGLVLGALLQVVVQGPGLRSLPLVFGLDLRHPALRRMALLYLPMLLGIAVAQLGAGLDRRLASGVHPQALAWMRYATTLQQFPQGLVATAVSMAALPTLARQVDDLPRFRRTLGAALRIVLTLTLPLGVTLLLLAEPAVALIFQRDAFTAADTVRTAEAVRLYLVGLPFAALDLPLVYAFYARGNTLTPNLVAIVGVAAYLVVALPLIGPFGFLGLVAANAAQLATHAVAMLLLAHVHFDALRGQGLLLTLGKVGLACAGLGVVVGGARLALAPLALTGFFGALIEVLVAGGLGALTFAAVAAWLRLAEVEYLARLVWARLRRP